MEVLPTAPAALYQGIEKNVIVRKEKKLQSALLVSMCKMFVLLVVLMGMATSAQAVQSLRLSSGGVTQTITDNDGDGILLFYGQIGSFFLNVTTGLSKPTIGSSTSPHLDLVSVDVSGSQGGTLTIEQTDTDFSSASPWLASTQIGGVTIGSLTHEAYFDSTNTAFGRSPGGQIGSTLGTFHGAFAGSSSEVIAAAEHYSLTQVITIVHSGFGNSSFNAELTTVPEASATLLLGLSLLGVVGGYGLRRKMRILA